jgi:hypothetical protein
VPIEAEVEFRHRRRPPILHYGVMVSVALVAASVSAANLLWTPLLIVFAAAAFGLALLGRRRFWVEDQVITRDAVAIVRPDGVAGDIPLQRLVRAADRRTGIRFTRDDGALLDFSRNPHGKRVHGLLQQLAPHIAWVEEIDPACDT